MLRRMRLLLSHNVRVVFALRRARRLRCGDWRNRLRGQRTRAICGLNANRSRCFRIRISVRRLLRIVVTIQLRFVIVDGIVVVVLDGRRRRLTGNGRCRGVVEVAVTARCRGTVGRWSSGSLLDINMWRLCGRFDPVREVKLQQWGDYFNVLQSIQLENAQYILMLSVWRYGILYTCSVPSCRRRPVGSSCHWLLPIWRSSTWAVRDTVESYTPCGWLSYVVGRLSFALSW